MAIRSQEIDCSRNFREESLSSMIASTESTLLGSIVERLRLIEDNRAFWERVFDVHDRFLSPRISAIIATKPSDFALIQRGLDDETSSYRRWMDAVVASACWLFLNAGLPARSCLLHAIEPWGGIVTLLANISGRFRDQYVESRDLRWAKYALSALSLLGSNFDTRGDLRLLENIWQAMVRDGADYAVVFLEMAAKVDAPMRQEYEKMAHNCLP